MSRLKADIALPRGVPRLRATGGHLPYGITQCYLPPNTSECATPNPSHAGWYSIYLLRRLVLNKLHYKKFNDKLYGDVNMVCSSLQGSSWGAWNWTWCIQFLLIKLFSILLVWVKKIFFDPHRYSSCCSCSSCYWGRRSSKSLRHRRFKCNRDEIWQNCSSSKRASIDGVEFSTKLQTFKMAHGGHAYATPSH